MLDANRPGMPGPMTRILKRGGDGPDQLLGPGDPAVAIPKEFRSHRKAPRSPNFPSSEQRGPGPECAGRGCLFRNPLGADIEHRDHRPIFSPPLQLRI